MSRVMVDTNVWVDVVLNRPQFAPDSKGAIMACLKEGDEVLIAATSLKDVFYFATKSAGAEAGYRTIELILDVATCAQVDSIACKSAIPLERPDYEDGIVAACALAEGADAIVTRDERAFGTLGIRKYSPGEFISARGFEPTAL